MQSCQTTCKEKKEKRIEERRKAVAPCWMLRGYCMMEEQAQVACSGDTRLTSHCIRVGVAGKRTEVVVGYWGI